MEPLSHLLGDCFAGLTRLAGGFLDPGSTVCINGRRFQLHRQIGEGGYAYVYLATEQCSTSSRASSPPRFAVKKVIAASGERIAAVRREIEVQRQLRHPNLLPLLDCQEVSGSSAAAIGRVPASHSNGSTLVQDPSSGPTIIFYLLTPAFTHGTLAERVAQLQGGAGPGSGQQLRTRHVLDIFLQLCAAVQHMHDRGFCHRDIKPHNVLLAPRSVGGAQQHAGAGAASTQLLPAWRPAPPHHMQPSKQAAASAGVVDVEMGGMSSSASDGYHAVLMDFGSARPLMTSVNSRLEALALQEDAQASCTATYRAPELFDVPSSCVIDGARCDVWSLGASLFHAMYGASPFQRAVDEGGSLELAVINCAVPWPRDPRQLYPEPLHQLVMLCLQRDPAQRPPLADVVLRAQQLAAMDLPGPRSAQLLP